MTRRRTLWTARWTSPSREGQGWLTEGEEGRVPSWQAILVIRLELLSKIAVGTLRNIQESVVSATSAEISVIRRPRVTLPQQDVLLEEEEEEECGDDEQNSFQSCNSSPTSPPTQHDHVDSRLTEVESQSNMIRRSRGKLEVEEKDKEVVKSKKKEEVVKGKRETSGHVEKSLTAGQTGNQTPNFKCPPGTGLFDILNALWT